MEKGLIILNKPEIDKVKSRTTIKITFIKKRDNYKNNLN